MIDRETKDTGMWSRQDVALQWTETTKPKEPGRAEPPTIYRKQDTGQLSWVFLIKCTGAVDMTLNTDDQLEEYLWQFDIHQEMQAWQTWVLDSAIITDNREIRLTGQRFGLRRNEMLSVMLTMRSETIGRRTWFGQIRTEI
jgi:hypothetical protein